MVDVFLAGEALAVGLVGANGFGDCMPVGAGGAELNVAIALSLAGRDVHFSTRLGVDPFGILVERTLARAGVRALIEKSPDRPTGFYVREKTTRDRRVHYYRRGSAGSILPRASLLVAQSRHSRAVHLTGISAALAPENPRRMMALLDSAHTNGALTVFDVNFRPALWQGRRVARDVITTLAARSRVVLVGADEARDLWETDSLSRLAAILRVDELVVKDADRRIVTVVSSGQELACEVPPTDVVDAVGAGDAFAAGYIHAKISAMTTEKCVAAGHTFASQVLQLEGDVMTAEAVQRALEELS